MNISKRRLLAMLAASPLGVAIDFDPLARRIFLPPRGGWAMNRGVLTRGNDVIWRPLYDFNPATDGVVTFGEYFESASRRSLGEDS